MKCILLWHYNWRSRSMPLPYPTLPFLNLCYLTIPYLVVLYLVIPYLIILYLVIPYFIVLYLVMSYLIRLYLLVSYVAIPCLILLYLSPLHYNYVKMLYLTLFVPYHALWYNSLAAPCVSNKKYAFTLSHLTSLCMIVCIPYKLFCVNRI